MDPGPQQAFPPETLLAAYRNTGHRPYTERIDADLRDWVRFGLPYPARRNATDIWRGLEISFRAKIWAHVFYALQHDDTFLLPPARCHQLPEHAHHLRNFHGGNNWLTMGFPGAGHDRGGLAGLQESLIGWSTPPPCSRASWNLVILMACSMN